MNMQEHMDSCKTLAHKLKRTYPGLVYNKRLDIAAKSQGFKHYTSLSNLHKLLGPNKAPSTLAIIMAGGDDSECPYLQVNKTVEFR